MPLLALLAASFIATGAWAQQPDFDASLQSVLAQAQESGKKSQRRREGRGKWWRQLKKQQDALEHLRDLVEPAVLQIPSRASLGSGFIFDASGLVMTNNHVVDDAEEFAVFSEHIPETKAKVVARAPQRDIAILQLEGGRKDWPTLKFADYAQVKRAQPVYAFGNAAGYGVSIHPGLVQQCENGKINPYAVCLQSSVGSAPGISGGPTVNILGEVVGMNTALQPDAQSMSFSITGDLLRWAAEEYRENEELADYGIETDFISMPHNGGSFLVVMDPSPNSGLTPGDIVVSVEGRALPKDATAFQEILKSTARQGKGGKVRLGVLRNETQEDGSVRQVEAQVEVPMEKLSKKHEPMDLSSLIPSGS